MHKHICIETVEFIWMCISICIYIYIHKHMYIFICMFVTCLIHACDMTRSCI